MNKTITLDTTKLNFVRSADSRMSFNIEMAEVTGGTFWKAYTADQIAGKSAFLINDKLEDFTAIQDLMQEYPPIDLYDERLRRLTKALGPMWIRVSGSWATKT